MTIQQILLGYTSPVAPVVDYRANYTSTANNTTYTFSSCDIGPADADRKILVAIGGASGFALNRTLSSATVDGITLSIKAQQNDNHSTNESSVAAIAIVDVPSGSGTTADIVLTFNGQMSNAAIGVYHVTSLASDTPKDTLTTGGVNPSGTIDVTTNGVIVATAAVRGSGVSFSWTGITEDYDQYLETSGLFSSGIYEATLPETGRTITAANSATQDSQSLAAIAIGN